MYNCKGNKCGVFVIGMFFLMYIIITIGLYGDRISIRRHNKNMSSWKKEFHSEGIKNIVLVFNFDTFAVKGGDISRYWKKVKKVYVNNKLITPDKLYRKNDFIYTHCNENYALLINKDIDSIVYKFPPVDLYEEYVKQQDEKWNNVNAAITAGESAIIELQK